MTDLRYPIGEFRQAGPPTAADLQAWIEDIGRLPADLRAALSELSAEQLELPYRPGGWTVRQVVHHLADSHTHGYLRFKCALTEDLHVASSYDERLYIALAECESTPVEANLAYITALHRKVVILLGSLDRPDFERRLVHPDLGGVSLGEYAARLAWHGRHHLAHVQLVAAAAGD